MRMSAMTESTLKIEMLWESEHLEPFNDFSMGYVEMR